MPLSVNVNVQGTENVRLMFAGVERRSRRIHPLAIALTQDFKRIMKLQFDTEGEYLGAPWPNLAESTVIRKAREGLDDRILHATKVMRKEFTMGRGSYRIIGPGEMLLGSANIPAQFHQVGTSRMPQRMLFRFNQATQRRWTQASLSHIVFGTINLTGRGL
jgi:hypothetical protein